MVSKLAKIDEEMITLLGRVSKEFAEKIKRQYNLKQITIPNTLASQIVAGKYSGKKSFDFKIEKSGLNKGCLKLL